MRPFLLAAAACLLSLATGCSFSFVHGPPSPPIARAPEVDCTQSYEAPIADILLGGAAIAAGIVALGHSEPNCEQLLFCLDGLWHASGAMMLGTATFALVSSVVGFSKIGACRDVTERQRACAQGSAEACDRLIMANP